MFARASRFQVKAGEVLFKRGDPGDCAYLVESGRVSITVPSGDESVQLAIRGPGEVFGEMAIIDGRPRTATATVVEAGELVVLPREHLAARISHADPILRMYLRILLERFRETLNSLGEPEQATVEMGGSILTGDREGKTCYDDAIAEIRLERELQRALKKGEFELFFQPIVEISEGQIRGCEALIRWRHPERGLLVPEAFLNTAENSGLIVPMGRWILRRACQVLAEMDREFGESEFFMSVNLSGQDFASEEIVSSIATILTETGVRPSQIKLEITETILVGQPELAIRILHDLKKLGVKISLDDFGTGYSSLSYLHRFPIDTLKIDRSFVTHFYRATGISALWDRSWPWPVN